MHKIFTSLYYLIQKNRLISIFSLLLMLFVCVFFASKIKFEEDINQIIPKNEKSNITAKVLKQLSFSDKIVVIIENKSKENGFQLSETANIFLEKTKPLHEYIKNIQGKVNDEEITQTFDFISQNLPLFLDEKDYKEIEAKISKDSIAKKVEANYISMVSPTSLVTKNFIKKDPLGISFIGLKKLNNFSISKDFKLEDNYIVTKDGNNLLLFIDPKFGGGETKNNEKFVGKLTEIKTELNQKYKGKTELSYFGSPMIAVANAKQIKNDIQKTVFISMAILFAMLIFYFKNFLTPLIIFIPTVVSVVFGLAFMFFVKDKISAISLSVGAILLGITIDYALHILTHYKHKSDIREVYKEITPPIIMSAATTSISFLCLVFVRSEALRDLGIFASVTVMLSAIFSLIIIPHIYKPKLINAEKKSNFIDKIGEYPYEKNKFLVIFCFAIIIISFFGFRHVKFNNNIGDLNFMPEEMKTSEAKLEKLSDITSKSIYTVSYGKTEAEVLEKNSQLFNFLNKQKAEKKILSFNSIGEMVLSKNEQEKKIERWNSFWSETRKKQVISALINSGNQFGFKQTAFSDFSEMLNKKRLPISLNDYKALKALQLNEFMNHENGLYTVSTLVKIDEKNRDNFIKLVEKNGNVLAIDRQQMNENFLGLLKNDFNSLVNYSLIAVIIIFLLFFRNIDLTIMATIPIILSGIVTAGILYFLGLELNIFSTIVCTLIFGAGVDFNIFLTQAMQKELTTGKNDLPTYRISIILALLTTVLAVGALVFAKHPALFSVSIVALIGMFAVVIISFALYPLLFYFVMNRSQKGLSPVSFRIFFNSVFSLIIYVGGGILFGFFGRFIIPNAHRKTLGRIKKFIAFYLKTVLYSNPFVKKKVINTINEDFKKPAIIIANHTSSLDTLAMALATHKVVYLVNDWVYSSPVFGKLVRALGFFPVSQGVENGMEKLQEKINEGFSLMVFPEAERSMDNNIKRFHKGAFYLAEQFNLDILPIYIHGNSEVMPKNEIFIYDGSITVKVGERISKNEGVFGKNYSERTKKINAFFRNEFANLRTELEDENYFKKMLFLSFLFKEIDLVKAIKKDFKINKTNYFELNKLIGKTNNILHISNDYGQLDVLLALNEASRRIFSYNENTEKRDISKQNYLTKRRKIFYVDDLQEVTKKIDTLLISKSDFDFSKINEFPENLILFNTNKPFGFEKLGYILVNQANKIKVYKKQ